MASRDSLVETASAGRMTFMHPAILQLQLLNYLVSNASKRGIGHRELGTRYTIDAVA
jgi:hypothetical protein